MRRLARGCLTAVLAVIGIVIVSVLVLGVEVWVATRGPRPDEPPPAADDLPAGPVPLGAGAPPAVLWLGDSTAAGVGASNQAAALPEQVAGRLAESVRLTVLARSGARIADVLRSQLPQVARWNPTEVFISVGANDTTHLTGRSRFRRDYDRLLAGLPPSVRRVVVLGVPDMGAPPRLAEPLRAVAGWRGRQLALDIANLARRRGAVFVDIAGATGQAFRHQPGRYFASDHYHPSDAGYRLWADAVAAALQTRGQAGT